MSVDLQALRAAIKAEQQSPEYKARMERSLRQRREYLARRTPEEAARDAANEAREQAKCIAAERDPVLQRIRAREGQGDE